MSFHSRLLGGNQEWVISIIGALNQQNQAELTELSHSFHQKPLLCTIDFSKADELNDETLTKLLTIPLDFEKIQIIGCSSALLNRIKYHEAANHNIGFL